MICAGPFECNGDWLMTVVIEVSMRFEYNILKSQLISFLSSDKFHKKNFTCKLNLLCGLLPMMGKELLRINRIRRHVSYGRILISLILVP